jgi:hypothetical protein
MPKFGRSCASSRGCAARAWLEGDPILAAERYGAIVIDRPRDIFVALVNRFARSCG